MNMGTRIGLVAAMYLAEHESQDWIDSERIVAECGVHRHYLPLMMRRLVKANLVASRTHHGYKLARPAQTISLLKILEALEIPIGFAAVLPETGQTCFNGKLEQVFKQGSEKAAAVLEKVNLRQLVER